MLGVAPSSSPVLDRFWSDIPTRPEGQNVVAAAMKNGSVRGGGGGGQEGAASRVSGSARGCGSRRDAVLPRLQLVELRIEAVRCHQLIVRAPFRHLVAGDD